MNEITDSLARAFDRIDDFEAVQSGRTPEQLLDAVLLLQESVGIRDQSRSVLVERLAGTEGVPRARGHLLLGVIVGLMAAELAAKAR
jgi:hypothetical protein